MPKFIEKILSFGDRKNIKQAQKSVDATNAFEEAYKELSDEELREQTDLLKARYEEGESLDALLPEAFATVREAAARTLGMRHFDVQLLGGAALHAGNIAEMKTGEGKTLVATAPAYLNALAGKGVHIVTVNDYLAKYQGELMGRVFRFLGLDTGIVVSGQNPEERRKQYAADITYGTNNEFGFDYLRDNMALSADEKVQREHNFVIVDEVDSILIDEARTPLIISGQMSDDINRWYEEFASLAHNLEREEDYEVDEKKRTVGILETGVEKVEDYLGVSNLYEASNNALIGFLNNSLKAKELYKKDKDYIVQEGEVFIVDEHTGRVLEGRRYSEGMHQAIEAKEKVDIKAENQTLATVTLQNYFRMYDKLSGMTGTAETEAAEFMSTYDLGVVPIPTNKDMDRIDQSDLIFRDEELKFDAVVDDIVDRHAKGQPVLVGTTSVEKSEYLSKRLKAHKIDHTVLNAKNHAQEASIVAQAGRKNAVTVATNMAGRGTDIMLGGNAEHKAVAEMERRGLDPEENPVEYETQWPDVLEESKQSVQEEHDEVVEAGGLYVLGTERHESRRIDNQLRGRSGRQGDPGESRFYLSFEDDLVRLFQPNAADGAPAKMLGEEAMESKMVSNVIAKAQSGAESRNAEMRKNVLKYDDVLNRQREAIYKDRNRILEGGDLQETVSQFTEDTLTKIVNSATAEGHGEDWDLDDLWKSIEEIYPISITVDDLLDDVGDARSLKRDKILKEIIEDAKIVYQEKEEEIGSEQMREIERAVVLSTIGRSWQEHLYDMDYLKEGISLRAMAQRDPVVEYQREGFDLFSGMMDRIKAEAVTGVYSVRPTEEGDESDEDKVIIDVTSAKNIVYSAPDESGQETSVAQGDSFKKQSGGSKGVSTQLSGHASRAAQSAAQRKKQKGKTKKKR